MTTSRLIKHEEIKSVETLDVVQVENFLDGKLQVIIESNGRVALVNWGLPGIDKEKGEGIGEFFLKDRVA